MQTPLQLIPSISHITEMPEIGWLVTLPGNIDIELVENYFFVNKRLINVKNFLKDI